MRCYGAYFCADDQKLSRTDSLEHEYVDLATDKTNYTGFEDTTFIRMYLNIIFSSMYFGEYPLSFAACMNHSDCMRLVHAYKVCHSNVTSVISNYCNDSGEYECTRYEWEHRPSHVCYSREFSENNYHSINKKMVSQEMLRLAIELGASLKVKNKQKLSPLTLAAKLAKNRVRNEINMRGMILNCRCLLNYSNTKL